jgi:hypothetical protein
MLIETLRILGTEFTIATNQPELIERLPYVAQHADQTALELRQHCTITVMWDGEEYCISGGSLPDKFESSLSVAFNTLFARLHEYAMAGMDDHIRIHAASGIGSRGMFLLVGEKFSGKTTLAMHLLLAGHDILGDELVLLKHGVGVTFPRRFYVRSPALDLLPDLAEATQGAPFVNADIQGRLLAIDPLVLGRAWRIRPAPLQAVIFIEPNHGGASVRTSCSKIEIIRRVMTQASPPSSNRRDWVADLCASINQAETWVLSLGDLAGASENLRGLIS